jgi:hypothetical protein
VIVDMPTPSSDMPTAQTRTKDGRKIITEFVYPPIPDRRFDWSAVTEDYDAADDAKQPPMGHGATEEAAIADLLEQLDD